MKYFAVATLKRGVIDPPERLSPWIEDAIFGAEYAAAKRELEQRPAADIELQWMRDGLEFRDEECRRRKIV